MNPIKCTTEAGIELAQQMAKDKACIAVGVCNSDDGRYGLSITYGEIDIKVNRKNARELAKAINLALDYLDEKVPQE